MRRRQAANPAPRNLLTYRAEDWPGGCHPECAYWAAVEAWHRTHPDEDLDLENAPDGAWHPEDI